MKKSYFFKTTASSTKPLTFKHLLAGIFLLVSQSATSEELTNVKVIGGFLGDCSESNANQTNYLQPLTLTLKSSKKSGSILSADFEVQFMECDRNSWVKRKFIKSEFIQNVTDELKQKQKEKTSYSNFRIQIQNTTGDSIQTIPIPSENAGVFKFKVKVNSLDISKDEESKSKFIDIVLRADRNRQNAADHYFEDVNWGRVRVPLN